MLLFAGLALTLTAFIIWRGRKGAWRKPAADLGSMSDQWLSEHRASSMN